MEQKVYFAYKINVLYCIQYCIYKYIYNLRRKYLHYVHIQGHQNPDKFQFKFFAILPSPEIVVDV